jgi:hypothetical protein
LYQCLINGAALPTSKPIVNYSLALVLQKDDNAPTSSCLEHLIQKVASSNVSESMLPQYPVLSSFPLHHRVGYHKVSQQTK